ncbi:hypothetical protein BE20_20270 [Sorangium cellulosum]|nr:hypothetical protein BE20_20270 [Sorangium cellulosum]
MPLTMRTSVVSSAPGQVHEPLVRVDGDAARGNEAIQAHEAREPRIVDDLQPIELRDQLEPREAHEPGVLSQDEG